MAIRKRQASFRNDLVRTAKAGVAHEITSPRTGAICPGFASSGQQKPGTNRHPNRPGARARARPSLSDSPPATSRTNTRTAHGSARMHREIAFVLGMHGIRSA